MSRQNCRRITQSTGPVLDNLYRDVSNTVRCGNLPLGVETGAEDLEDGYWSRVRKPGRTNSGRIDGDRGSHGGLLFDLHLYRHRRGDVGTDVNQLVTPGGRRVLAQRPSVPRSPAYRSRNIRRRMNKCPYCEEIVSRPIAEAVETNTREMVVLISCPFCLKILGVTRI